MSFVQSDGNFEDVLANMNFEKIIGDFMAVLSPLWDMDANEMGSGDHAEDSLGEILAFKNSTKNLLLIFTCRGTDGAYYGVCKKN